MKKFVAIILALGLVFSLCACSESEYRVESKETPVESAVVTEEIQDSVEEEGLYNSTDAQREELVQYVYNNYGDWGYYSLDKVYWDGTHVLVIDVIIDAELLTGISANHPVYTKIYNTMASNSSQACLDIWNYACDYLNERVDVQVNVLNGALINEMGPEEGRMEMLIVCNGEIVSDTFGIVS